jgi:hypothetical protein
MPAAVPEDARRVLAPRTASACAAGVPADHDGRLHLEHREALTFAHSRADVDTAAAGPGYPASSPARP